VGGGVLLFCYEAGPGGYGLYRQYLSLGHDCQVISPSQIPQKPAERIKTDRQDARKLARALRSGDLTAAWVPDEEQEALGDLTQARDDIKSQERKARQQPYPTDVGGIGLEGTEAPVWALSNAHPNEQEYQVGVYGGGTGVGRVHLGHCEP
jgi:hypothetical protein